MEQLQEMFKEKFGYYPMPDDSNPPEVVINRLKEVLFGTRELILVANNGRSNLGE